MKPAKLLTIAIMALSLGNAALAQNDTEQPSKKAAPWRASISLAGTTPSGGLVAQAAISHDDLLGALGVRLAAEYGFSQVPLSITAGVIEVAPIGPVDLYAGLGIGTSFESTGVLIYG